MQLLPAQYVQDWLIARGSAVDNNFNKQLPEL